MVKSVDSESRILKAPCTILVRSQTAKQQLSALLDQFHADAVYPLGFKCNCCGLEWEGSPFSEWTTVDCSNCYSQRAVLTVVELEFCNWGEQNGGTAERDERYEDAKRYVYPVMRELESLKEPRP